MKFSSSALVCASVLSVLLASPGVQAKGSVTGLFKEKLAANTALKEDEKYWNRLMQESMSVAPTPPPPTPPPPTPEPGTPPTPEPGTPPTPPPPTPPPTADVACEVDAEVTCATADDAAIDCNTIVPDSENCMVDVVYSYVAENIGTNDMTITTAQSQFKEETPLEVPIVGTTLTPGETVVYLEERTIDACANEECPMTFEVEAESENGKPCMDEDVYILDIAAPPTPPPTPETITPEPTPPPTTPPTMAPTEECDITIDVGCIPLEAAVNATSCEALPPLVTICEERPTWMQFKYYGGDCNMSANMQTEKFFCTDFASIPQDPETEVYMLASADDDEDTIFFSGNVKLNDLYNVTDPSGDRLPADMNLTLYDSDPATGGTLLQRVQYHSSCSQNLFLKDKFGASQLVAFFNEEQGLVDCFVTSNYTFTIANNGSLPATLDSLVALTTPFGPFDLTEEVLAQGP